MSEEKKEPFELEWDKLVELRKETERKRQQWLRQIKKDKQHIALENKIKICKKILIQLNKERRAFRTMNIPIEIKELQERERQQHKLARDLQENAFKEMEEAQEKKVGEK
jgi:hypothetical protein